MDIFKDISNSEERDIIISLPKDKSWLEYLSIFANLKVNNNFFKIIVSTIPKTVSGKKCFIVFDGYLRGWMNISNIKETVDNEICIELTPTVTTISYKVVIGDIDEYKYFFDNSSVQ